MDKNYIYVTDFEQLNELAESLGKARMMGKCANWLSDELLFNHCSRNEITTVPENIFIGLHAIRYLSEAQEKELDETIDRLRAVKVKNY